MLPDQIPAFFTARLLGRIDIRGADECWEWTAGRVSGGYGAIDLPRVVTGGRKIQAQAHRLTCLIFHGPPPSESHFALHSCDNPPCCNPKHLRWGTHDENMADAVERGRLKDNISHFNESPENRGTNHHMAKLTDDDVREIRRRLEAGESIRSIADEFGVWENAVRRIKNGEGWAHVA